MSEKRVNSHEIARIAGVSRSTVSRVINNIGNVKEQTRDHVLRVIEQYAYAPDFSAQRLAGKPAKTIGLFFAADRKGDSTYTEDLLVDFMLERIIEMASDRDFFVLARIIRDAYQDPRQVKMQEMFTQRRIDGGIFIGFPNHYAPIEELIAKGHVVGIMDQCIPGRQEPNRIVVNFDNDTMGEALKYLYGKGHRNILTVLGDPRRYNGVQKEASWRKTMKALHLKVRRDWICYGGFIREQARVEVDRFLRTQTQNPSTSPRPTAILCGSDDMAYGVLDALKEHGLRVPEDYSVVGVDDSLMSRYTTPPLTTYHVDFETMLRTLVDHVIACVKDPFVTQHVDEFNSSLVERESCLPAGEKREFRSRTPGWNMEENDIDENSASGT